MSRKPTVDDFDDVDDDDGALEEEVATTADLKLTVTDESEAGLGGLPQNLPEEEEERKQRVLIDVHAHFLHDRSPRTDWRERNASRWRAGERVGITVHVASILGSWGATS